MLFIWKAHRKISKWCSVHLLFSVESYNTLPDQCYDQIILSPDRDIISCNSSFSYKVSSQNASRFMNKPSSF